MKPAIIGLLATGIIAGASLGTSAETLLGEPQEMGRAKVRTYVEVGGGKPSAIGILLSSGALDGLSPKKNMTSRCADLNKNGKIDDASECEGDYELKLSLPSSVPGRDRIPFQWIGVNWNPEGHPPEAWSVPHFDFHFYIADRNEIEMIRVGVCPIFINCDDKERAMLPLEDKYVAPDHISVGAAVGQMGNHLIDKLTPELNPEAPKPFTHTWIFGAFDRRIIFYEPMITMEFLRKGSDACYPIRQPAAWQKAGYYPTSYCIRHGSGTGGDHTISIEGLIYREAG